MAYLIGSVANGRARQDSDLDIALVVDRDQFDTIDYGQIHLSISHALREKNLDLRLVTEDKISPLYMRQIASGKLLYDRNEEERVDFEAKTMINYFDTQHLRDIFHYYVDKRIEGGQYGR